MRSRRTILALPLAAFIFLVLVVSVFAQARTVSDIDRGARPATLEESRDEAPITSRGTSPTSPTVAPSRTFDGGGTPPGDPGHVMDTESADIYIYVTLMAPEGPDPPDSVVITEEDCTPDAEYVRFKASAAPFSYGGDYYHIYRDTVALFYMAMIDSSNLLPDHTASLYFTDYFTDTYWPTYIASSKGVCDTLVNLFYVFTTVDTGATAPGGFSESPYPSWCMCEYDQGMKRNATFGSTNFISIPCYDDDYEVASDLDGFNVTDVQEWNPVTQNWSTVGYKHPILGWLTNNALMVSHVYKALGTTMPLEALFSTYEPGLVPENDTIYTIQSTSFGDRNIIMLPFKNCYIDGITNCSTLETSLLGVAGPLMTKMYQVDKWNTATMSWQTIGTKHAILGWLTNPHLRPGMPYRIWIDATGPFDWPMS